MKKSLVAAIILATFMQGVAISEEILPPTDALPPIGEIENVRELLREQCATDASCGQEQLGCWFDALQRLKQNGAIDEVIFRFLIREIELQIAFRDGFNAGKEEAAKQCGKPPIQGGGPEDNDKVKVCHIPPGNPDNAHTIEIGEAAVDAHLAHGDTLGECVNEEDPGDDDGDNGKDKKKKSNEKNSGRGKKTKRA